MDYPEFFVMHGLFDFINGNFVFANRNDRNEVALSLYQERCYEMFYEYTQSICPVALARDFALGDVYMNAKLGRAKGQIGAHHVLVIADSRPADRAQLYGVDSMFSIGKMLDDYVCIAFDNESDRNEMALALYQEAEWLLAMHMEHYPEDYSDFCVAAEMAYGNIGDFVATFVDGERDQVKAPKGLKMMPTIDYQDLREALIEEYGELFCGANVLDIMFGEFYQNDCAKEYNIWGGEYPVIDYEGCYGDANDSYRRFLIDEYLMRIVPRGVEYIMINICW